MEMKKPSTWFYFDRIWSLIISCRCFLIITCVNNNVVIVAVDVHVVIVVVTIVAVAAVIDVDKGVAGVNSSGPTRPDRLLHLG